ncbi:MAG: hypothetical protein Q7R40_19895 [Phaeospirillum sp.]|nr:hypothetical protein [Phaeospirillum sp.]
MFRRLSAPIVMAVLLATVMGCVGDRPPLVAESREELAEFQQEILADMDKVEVFQQKTLRGINVSEFNLGWFVMILLNELGSHDPDLYDYIHTGEMNVEFYLRNSFRADPQKEIAILDGMAEKANPAIRLAARHALEALTRIPNGADSSAVQAQTRKDLSATLSKLRTVLGQVAEQATPR